MSGRAHLLGAVAIAAVLAATTPALSQDPPAGIENRLPDPAWLPTAPGAPRAVVLADQLVDPVLPAGERRRQEAVDRLLRTGLIGGVAQEAPATSILPATRVWAVQFGTPGGARAGLEVVRWALRVRSDTSAQRSDELADPADGRIITTTAADGTVRVDAVFAAGSWLYGVGRAAAPGADPGTAGLAALAAHLWARQPERPDPIGAQPLGVTPELRAALAAAHARAMRRPPAVPVEPLPGTVQAASLAGTGWALARFPRVDGDPELFRTAPDGAWVAVGDPGGPGCPRIPAAVREVWGLTATCPASPSPVVRPDDPDALAVEDSPFDGIGTWVWEVGRSGGVAAIAARARSNGMRTVFLKSGDGTRYWRQFDEALPALRAAGLKVCAWQYIYGRRPVLEARVAARAVRSGADCFVVNAETEFKAARNAYEGRTYRAARRYMAELRRLVGPGHPVGLTSFAYVDGHSSFPYSAFMDGPNGADVLMPQVYWGAFGTAVDRAMERTARWNSIYAAPIAPIAGTYRRESPADLVRFRCLAAALGWPGASYWSFQHTRASQWPSLARPVSSCPTPAAVARTYPVLSFGRRGDPVVWLQARLRAWGVPVPRTGHYRQQTRAAVRAFQRARGLEPDGVAGPLTWALLLERPPVPDPAVAAG